MKKLFALILTVCLLATMSVTAFAVNTTGGSTTITIDGTSYQAEAGMTWAEWVADPAYNTVGLEKDGEWYIVDPSTNKAVFKGEWETCNPSDVIVADYEYYLDWIME